ncbi:flagellar associated protein [Tribonema minus]|nr:flagellar associated protein [Tribonema minus]
MSTAAADLVGLTPFCLRQFTDSTYPGTKITHPPDDFNARVNEYLAGGGKLHEGYAEFCKHLFMKNFAGIEGSIVPITAENEPLLRTCYEARRPAELPVLLRYFPRGSVPAPAAPTLDIILYSGEQIRKERAARQEDDTSWEPQWGIVGIKAQAVDYEIPMQPITMLRNALGRSEGGSGVALNAQKYSESVEFWSAHAIIK